MNFCFLPSNILFTGFLEDFIIKSQRFHMKKFNLKITAINFSILILMILFNSVSPVRSEEYYSDRTASVIVQPGIMLPLGSSEDYFKNSAGFTAGFNMHLLDTALILLLESGYIYSPIKAQDSVSILSVKAGTGAGFRKNERLAVKLYADAGYYYAFLNDAGTASSQVCWSTGINFGFILTPSFNLILGTSYSDYRGLVKGAEIFLGTSLHLGNTEIRKRIIQPENEYKIQLLQGVKKPMPGTGLTIAETKLNDIYPVFYKYYDDNPAGYIKIKNNAPTSVYNIKISFFIKQYMDTPKVFFTVEELESGKTLEIPVYALFSDRILEITESTKVPVELAFEFKQLEEMYGDKKTETVRILDRNAMTWDDDRKAAAFITAKDPAVLNFAKNTAGIARNIRNKAASINLQTAIIIHEALTISGLNYIIDPQTPYLDKSKSTGKIDYLQFPRQTLEYKAGDCDDLSILYCALLESVGIETAFITVPGHIYAAFALELNPAEAGGFFRNPDNLIYIHNKVWIPVEITERKDFLSAWDKGAAQWRENYKTGKASFYRIHDAWLNYEPVAYPEKASALQPADPSAAAAALKKQLELIISREMNPQLEKIEKELAARPEDPVLKNKYALCFARYGYYDKAKTVLEDIVKEYNYIPALINYANILYLNKDNTAASAFYEKVKKLEPDNEKALLGLAKLYYEAGNAKQLKVNYEALKNKNQKLALQYSYMEGKTGNDSRAGAERMEAVLWQE
jgi:hypothetical protein